MKNLEDSEFLKMNSNIEKLNERLQILEQKAKENDQENQEEKLDQ